MRALLASIAIVSAAGLSACGKKPPSCPAIADHVVSLFGAADEHGRDVRAIFLQRCEQDRWPAAMRTCLRGTRALTEPRNCKQHLTADQSQQLEAELEAAEQRLAARTIPLACTQYEQLVASVQSCTSIPPEVRAALVKRLAEAKQEWGAVADKRRLAPICSSASYALRPLDCTAPAVPPQAPPPAAPPTGAPAPSAQGSATGS